MKFLILVFFLKYVVCLSIFFCSMFYDRVLLLMSDRRIFFQDFLFEGMPVDEQDYPIVNMKKLPPDVDINSCIVVSFDAMLRMNKRKEWDELFEKTKNRSVCILDDVPINNSEMEPYKRFYLSAYYFNLSKCCNNVYFRKKQV